MNFNVSPITDGYLDVEKGFRDLLSKVILIYHKPFVNQDEYWYFDYWTLCTSLEKREFSINIFWKASIYFHFNF